MLETAEELLIEQKEKNIWLHRISHHAEVAYPLLEKGYLSIGYSDFCNSEFIENIKANDGWLNFESAFDEMWGVRPKTRFNLWRYLAEMQKGDLVVVPSWGTFSIYEIEESGPELISDLVFTDLKNWQGQLVSKKENGLLQTEQGSLIDLGFVRRVRPIKKNISRSEFADAALTSRMKIRTTNANISDLKESVNKALESAEKGEPINIYSEILKSSLQNVFNTIRKELTPDKFEVLVKWYFQRIGASEVYIPSKNESGKEGDADVVAVFEPLKLIIFAQVKFHVNETSQWAIEQIKSYKDQKELMDDGYSKIGWVVSTADKFSQLSMDLAKENKVQLIDGNQFATMLLDAGIVNLNKAL